MCEDCHSGNQAPHQNSELNNELSIHTDYIACQTCHIPAYARGQATKMTWDWSTAGDRDENGKYIVKKDEAGHVIYDGRKGSFTHADNVVPYYTWWNGNTYFLTVEDQIDPSQPVKINTFEGARGDGKIYPFKRFTGTQPYDAGNNVMAVPHLFPSSPDDTAAFWKGYDWDSAVSAGMASVGANYSNNLGWVDTEMFWVQNHMVAPKDNALRCQDCHSENGRLDFVALGYSPEDATLLASAADDVITSMPSATAPQSAPAAETPAELPKSGGDLTMVPWLMMGVGSLLALGGSWLWKRRS
jgi:LPXTG-motif cell wall-anchored protein